MTSTNLDALVLQADSLYFDQRDYAEAFGLYLQAAEAGDADAMRKIALMYYDGEGVSRDFEKSIEWDKRAVEAGMTSAMHNLAITYRTMGDCRTAREWFEKAIAAGEIDSALDLARLLMVSDKEAVHVRALLEQVVTSSVATEGSIEDAKTLLKTL